MSARPIAVLVALALAGCASQDSPDDRRFPAPGPTGGWNEPAVRLDWSDGLSLAEVLGALDRYGRTRAALEEIEAARGRRVAAEEPANNPELGFEGAQSVDGDATTLGVGVSQVFELGGRRRRRTAVAEAGIGRAEAEARDVRREMRARAVAAYWAAVAAERRVEVARRSAELADKVVEVAVARYEARQAAAIDVNLAKVRAGQARAGVRRAEGEAESARAEVMAFVGGEAPAGWKLADAFPADRPAVNLAEALGAARRGRPDLQALDAAGVEAGARIELARSEAAPDLGVGLGYEFERDRVEGDGVDIRDSSHSITLGLTLTLPVLKRRRGDIAEAESDRRRLAALRSALEAEVARDVESAEAKMRAAGDVLALYEKEVLPAAEKNLDDVRAAYAAGELAIVELLRAQEDWQTVLAESVEAAAGYAAARAELEAAIGLPLAEVLK